MTRPDPAKWEAPATVLGLALALVAVALAHLPDSTPALRVASAGASAAWAAAYLLAFPYHD